MHSLHVGLQSHLYANGLQRASARLGRTLVLGRRKSFRECSLAVPKEYNSSMTFGQGSKEPDESKSLVNLRGNALEL